jgi:hypothetical protein
MPVSLLAALLLLGSTSDAPLAPRPEAAGAPPAAVTDVAPAPRPTTGRAERISIELLVAGAAGVGVGALAGYVGCVATPSSNGQNCNTNTVAAAGLTGYGLTVAALVPMVGNALGGDGQLWVSWLGEAAGLGGGLALAQGNPKSAMFLCAPLMLVGAIVGYELTSGWNPPPRSTVGVQAVSLQPNAGGARLGVLGHF